MSSSTSTEECCLASSDSSIPTATTSGEWVAGCEKNGIGKDEPG